MYRLNSILIGSLLILVMIACVVMIALGFRIEHF